MDFWQTPLPPAMSIWFMNAPYKVHFKNFEMKISNVQKIPNFATAIWFHSKYTILLYFGNLAPHVTPPLEGSKWGQ